MVIPVLPSNCGAKTFVSYVINIWNVWVQTVQWKDRNESQVKVGGSSVVERPSIFLELESKKTSGSG